MSYIPAPLLYMPFTLFLLCNVTCRDDGEVSRVASKEELPSLPQDPRNFTEMLAPSTSAPSRFTTKWIAALPNWDSRKKDSTIKRLPRAVKIYYKKQQKDIAVLQEARKLSYLGSTEDLRGQLEAISKDSKKKKPKWSCVQLSVGTAARLTLSVNLLLLFLKLAATIQSGSLAVLSSLLDSALDLFSGIAIGLSSYLIKRYDKFHYPIGRNRLEPVAIIITAAVMGTAALQIITSAVEEISDGTVNPQINIFSGTIIVITIVLKASLYILCKQVNNPSVQTLAVDHRNDVASNIATLIFGLLGTYVLAILDPIGAIFLAFYIIINWVVVGYEQLKNLVGHTADRRFLSKLTWIAAHHDKRVETVDTVRAYTFGIYYLVEVHVQLSPDMPLKTAHDIGESLQQKLESLEEVERAFVHLDFETVHSPSLEHKLPN